MSMNLVARKFVRLRERNQVTLPNEILSAMPIDVGDFLEVGLTQEGLLVMTPTKLITSVNSAGARHQESLADKDIAEKSMAPLPAPKT